MSMQAEFEQWVAAVSRGHLGHVYIQFYADAPRWVRNMAVNLYGKGTVFLPSRQARPQAA